MQGTTELRFVGSIDGTTLRESEATCRQSHISAGPRIDSDVIKRQRGEASRFRSLLRNPNDKLLAAIDGKEFGDIMLTL